MEFPFAPAWVIEDLEDSKQPFGGDSRWSMVREDLTEMIVSALENEKKAMRVPGENNNEGGAPMTNVATQGVQNSFSQQPFQGGGGGQNNPNISSSQYSSSISNVSPYYRRDEYNQPPDSQSFGDASMSMEGGWNYRMSGTSGVMNNSVGGVTNGMSNMQMNSGIASMNVNNSMNTNMVTANLNNNMNNMSNGVNMVTVNTGMAGGLNMNNGMNGGGLNNNMSNSMNNPINHRMNITGGALHNNMNTGMITGNNAMNTGFPNTMDNRMNPSVSRPMMNTGNNARPLTSSNGYDESSIARSNSGYGVYHMPANSMNNGMNPRHSVSGGMSPSMNSGMSTNNMYQGSMNGGNVPMVNTFNGSVRGMQSNITNNVPVDNGMYPTTSSWGSNNVQNSHNLGNDYPSRSDSNHRPTQEIIFTVEGPQINGHVSDNDMSDHALPSLLPSSPPQQVQSPPRKTGEKMSRKEFRETIGVQLYQDLISGEYSYDEVISKYKALYPEHEAKFTRNFCSKTRCGRIMTSSTQTKRGVKTGEPKIPRIAKKSPRRPWTRMTKELFDRIGQWEKEQDNAKKSDIEEVFNVNRSTYHRWKKKLAGENTA